MIKDILKSIPDVTYYPIIALILFLALFTSIVIWTFIRMDKKVVKKMKELPFESSDLSKKNGEE